jgi:hypothetical protein
VVLASMSLDPMSLVSTVMLLWPVLWGLMFLDPMLLMVLRPMSLASRVLLLWDPMLWDPMSRVSRVMLLRPVALGCVRVRSRCCSNN